MPPRGKRECFAGPLKHEHVTDFGGRDWLLSSWIVNEFLKDLGDVSGADHGFIKALHVAGNSSISRDVNVLNINTCHSCRGLFSLIKSPFLQGDITSPLRAVDSSSCWQTSIHVKTKIALIITSRSCFLCRQHQLKRYNELLFQSLPASFRLFKMKGHVFSFLV